MEGLRGIIADAQSAFGMGESSPTTSLPFLSQMESAFDMDLGDISVHQGLEADAALSALGARAAQQGSSILLPTSGASAEMVGHEVAHYAQGEAFGSAGVHADGEASSYHDASEVEARDVGARAARGESVGVSKPLAAGVNLLGLGFLPNPLAVHPLNPILGVGPSLIKTGVDAYKVLSEDEDQEEEEDYDEELWGDNEWDNLTPDEQKSWKTLGWTEDNWDGDEWSTAAPHTSWLNWNRLSDAEKEAAQERGYDKESWDEERDGGQDQRKEAQNKAVFGDEALKKKLNFKYEDDDGNNLASDPKLVSLMNEMSSGRKEGESKAAYEQRQLQAAIELGALRGKDTEEATADYEKFKRVRGDRRATKLSEENKDHMGSQAQLAFGSYVGDALGIDPVYGALLSPTGGIVGPENTELIENSLPEKMLLGPMLPEAIVHHGAAHDAAGFLGREYDFGRGYEYADPNALYQRVVPDDQKHLAGQHTGILKWIELMSDTKTPGVLDLAT